MTLLAFRSNPEHSLKAPQPLSGYKKQNCLPHRAVESSAPFGASGTLAGHFKCSIKTDLFKYFIFFLIKFAYRQNMENLEFNVTSLVQKVTSKHLMFYPVMMHLLLKALNTQTGLVCFESPEGKMLQTPFSQKFEDFFQNYVYACLKEETSFQNAQPLCSFVLKTPNDATNFICLHPFKTIGTQIFLPVECHNIPLPNNFACLVNQYMAEF